MQTVSAAEESAHPALCEQVCELPERQRAETSGAHTARRVQWPPQRPGEEVRVSESQGYLILESLFFGSYYLEYYIRVPINGNSQVSLQEEDHGLDARVHGEALRAADPCS